MAKTINLGKVGLTFGGDYDSSKDYASRTCVFYNHVSWASKKDVPAGIAPGTNDAYWQKVSERGAQGIQGERGPQGNSAFDGTGIELVNNLTEGGEASALSAEQGKILKAELTELESEVQPSLTKIDFVSGFINTSVNPIDYNSPIATSSWNHAVIPCKEGDRFMVTGTGQRPSAYLWCFVMENGAIISHADSSNDVLENGLLIAPQYADYLILNDKSLKAECWKGQSLRNIAEQNEKEVADIKKVIDIEVQPSAEQIVYVKDSFIDVSANVIDIDATTSAPNSWNHAVVPCQEGDKFLISGQGQRYAAALWTFVDANGNKLLQADMDVYNAAIIVAPTNAAYLIMNNIASNKDISYINVPLRGFADIVEKRYKPYEDGFVVFTVGVNQFIPDLTNKNNETLDNETNIEQVICSVKLPTSYNPTGKPSRLLMMCHGAGKGLNGTNGWWNSADYNRLVNLFNAGGYVVFDCNGYANTGEGVNFWGAPKGVECWRKAYQYIVDNYNVEHQFSIYGFSMGGLTALQIANGMFPNVKCLALASPVTNLEYHFAGHEDLYAAGYGFVDSETYDEKKTKGADPLKGIITIGEKSICIRNYPPMKVWFGNNDTAVPYQYAKQLVDAIRNGNGLAYFREINGAGHEICYGANSKINLEYLYWIDRFNNRL